MFTPFPVCLLCLLARARAFALSDWDFQGGTSGDDRGQSVSSDSSNHALVAGWTSGNLSCTNAGGKDIFLMKLDRTDNSIAVLQVGTSEDDAAQAIAVDSLDNLIIAGYTLGPLDGVTTTGGVEDGFLMKFDNDGAWQWTVQVGSETSADNIRSIAVAANDDIVAVGSSAGTIDGVSSSGVSDFLIIRYDNDGMWQWTRMRGSAAGDDATSVVIDNGGNIILAGGTRGDMDGHTNAGLDDLAVVKYDSAGNWLWTHQSGSPAADWFRAVVTDSSDNIYADRSNSKIFVTGVTDGDLDGHTDTDPDIFLMQFDLDGNWESTTFHGSSARDVALGLHLDRSKNNFINRLYFGLVPWIHQCWRQ
ncbi:unnamed protein product [Effrenium voratum]|uniref:Uncharacterized protein n=1 Tax=Effrenium voratum TaxID=2562239 RepID=A0AA36IA42_9DINO|nr:unnamed protein product [Effrenium voratum]CAJ1413357.1 unnamed protein product [Effrenium voratum]